MSKALEIYEANGVQLDQLSTESMMEVVKYKELQNEMAFFADSERLLRELDELLEPGKHFGKLPYVSGADINVNGIRRITGRFVLRPEYEVQKTDLENEHREYHVKCRIVSVLTRSILSEGIGTCSTMEKKYRYVGKGDNRKPNPDLPDKYHTVQAMASKRSILHALKQRLPIDELVSKYFDDKGNKIRVKSSNATNGQSDGKKKDQGGIEKKLDYNEALKNIRKQLERAEKAGGDKLDNAIAYIHDGIRDYPEEHRKAAISILDEFEAKLAPATDDDLPF